VDCGFLTVFRFVLAEYLVAGEASWHAEDCEHGTISDCGGRRTGKQDVEYQPFLPSIERSRRRGYCLRDGGTLSRNKALSRQPLVLWSPIPCQPFFNPQMVDWDKYRYFSRLDEFADSQLACLSPETCWFFHNFAVDLMAPLMDSLVGSPSSNNIDSVSSFRRIEMTTVLL
jgi:hypothetical protein